MSVKSEDFASSFRVGGILPFEKNEGKYEHHGDNDEENDEDKNKEL